MKNAPLQADDIFSVLWNPGACTKVGTFPRVEQLKGASLG
jgi:hypothetical protein